MGRRGAGLAQLDGYEIAAGAWETEVLPLRVTDYEPAMLDTLCLTGRAAWGRLSPPAQAVPRHGGDSNAPRRTRAPSASPIRTTPIALFLREHAQVWLSAATQGSTGSAPRDAGGVDARDVLLVLHRHGALFFSELVAATRLIPTQVERALAELAAAGLVTADGFAGLRALLTPSDRRRPLGAAGTGIRRTKGHDGVETAGRWSLLRTDVAQFREAEGQGFRPAPEGGPARRHAQGTPSPSRGEGLRDDDAGAEIQARTLLRRYGIVFRRVLAREGNLAAWRELTRIYRRLEARGEIRGGRFVSGMSGEQFALPEAVAELRAVRKKAPDGALLGISAADPLNLAGVVTTGEIVPALAANRLVYRDGVPLAAREAGRTRPLVDYDARLRRLIEQALVRRRLSDALKARLAAMGALPR